MLLSITTPQNGSIQMVTDTTEPLSLIHVMEKGHILGGTETLTRANSLKISAKEMVFSPLPMAMCMKETLSTGCLKVKESTLLAMGFTEAAGKEANTTVLAFSNSTMDLPTVALL